MNQQYLTKLANVIVKKREKHASFKKRAALWDKLLRSGQLSEKAIQRLFAMGGSGRLASLFPKTIPASRRGSGLLSRVTPAQRVPGAAAGEISGLRFDGPQMRDDIVRQMRKLIAPAEPYSPMAGILKRLAEMKKAKGKLAPSSKLDKGLFKSMSRTKPGRLRSDPEHWALLKETKDYYGGAEELAGRLAQTSPRELPLPKVWDSGLGKMVATRVPRSPFSVT